MVQRKKSPVEISKLNVKQLQELQAQIVDRIDAIADEERKELAAEFRQKAAELGMTPEEIMRGRKRARKRAPAKQKYGDPKNPSRTWSGRGRQPVWVKEALASGKTLNDLRIST